MQHVTIVSVTATKNNTHTVVLADKKCTIKIEGVKFDPLTCKLATARHDVRLATSKHVRLLFNNWRCEEKYGGGYVHETITYVV